MDWPYVHPTTLLHSFDDVALNRSFSLSFQVEEVKKKKEVIKKTGGDDQPDWQDVSSNSI